MSARGVRIVVGEGPSTRKGLLRFVLDGEGYDVVAEAATTAELARLMATHRPDVVVLDDGIGATAVGMINEMSPNTKVVLVWPGAVVPIGGAARVEPSRVLQELGPTVERLTGQPSATGSGQGAALLESATNDPDMLRAMLLGGAVRPGEPIIEDREPAPVVILPLTPTIDHDELILNVPDAERDDDPRRVAPAGVAAVGAGAAMVAGSSSAAASEATTAAGNVIPLSAGAPAIGAQSALNRRLGNTALAGAAVASAIVLALALGGTRISVDGIRGQVRTPPATSSQTPGTDEDPAGDTDQGDPGQEPDGDRDGTSSTELFREGGTGTTADSPSSGSSGPPSVGVDPGDPPTGGSVGGGGGDGDGGGGLGGGSGSDTGGGGDDHNGGDAGDHDSGGGNDRDGGDHDNGGGNDGDSGDPDNGGGNDDADNPGNSGGNGGGSGGNGGGSGGNGGGSGGNGGGSGGDGRSAGGGAAASDAAAADDATAAAGTDAAAGSDAAAGTGSTGADGGSGGGGPTDDAGH